MCSKTILLVLAAVTFVVSNEVAEHHVMHFKRVGNQLLVFPPHELDDEWQDQSSTELHKALTKRSEIHQDPMLNDSSEGRHSESTPESLGPMIAETHNSIPSTDEKLGKQDDDNDGKVKSDVPDYRGDSVTIPLGQTIGDE
ncbi:hypothetical protein CROQUDRAFT_723635 [Cronartium quercuum f. sp. fusiforme G11]|uniref:Secreted protein n=1 Tax=Cronartium quercuum f. sp. fusiforme G11 TaxID=708437 RepID=A0A9P6TAC2_9BASI|nr:hypothetical protein CROQUDRAFT_723635 [Cronartium quercuum f. sp. fusiforme G11]